MLNRDNVVVRDVELAISEASEFRKAGGRTIVDVTLADIGRDPLGLRAISEATGLHVIAGCGHYTHAAHPDSLRDESMASISDRLVAELTRGIGKSGVRPGIIGELGTSEPLHPVERKVLQAAAQAQRATGVPISLHLHPPGRNAHEVLDVLESEGADLCGVVAGHIDLVLGHIDISRTDALAYVRSVAARGCYLGFDTFGKETHFASWLGSAFWCPSDRERIQAIAELAEEGFADRILVSQDASLKYTLRRFGGWGFAHLARDILPHVADFGIDDATVRRITVDNPAAMLLPAHAA